MRGGFPEASILLRVNMRLCGGVRRFRGNGSLLRRAMKTLCPPLTPPTPLTLSLCLSVCPSCLFVSLNCTFSINVSTRPTWPAGKEYTGGDEHTGAHTGGRSERKREHNLRFLPVG